MLGPHVSFLIFILFLKSLDVSWYFTIELDIIENCSLTGQRLSSTQQFLTPALFKQQWHGHICVRNHQRRRSKFRWKVVARWPDSVNQRGGCSCSVSGACAEASAGLAWSYLITLINFNIHTDTHICNFNLFVLCSFTLRVALVVSTWKLLVLKPGCSTLTDVR